MPRSESQKENKIQNILRKQYVSKQSTEPYEYKISKVLLRLWAKKINTSLTQKDTMDRGAWIKIQKEGMQEDLERTKKSKSTKVKNGMGMRNKRLFLFTYVMILWCPSWELLKDRGKNEIHILVLKRVI